MKCKMSSWIIKNLFVPQRFSNEFKTRRFLQTTGSVFQHYHQENNIKKIELKYLNEEQVRQYNDDGYTIAHNILTRDEVIEARKALDELIKKGCSMEHPNDIYEVHPDHSFDDPKIERVRFPSEQHFVFNKLLNHPLLLDAVEDLIGPSFRNLPQDKLNIKPAGCGSAIKWHQDWAFFPHTNDSILTASVALYDLKRENGCLQVIPESHKGPIVSHLLNNQFVSAIADKDWKPSNMKYLEAPAGSVTLHHVRAIHGSANNISKDPRSTVCFIFTAMDAWPLLGVGGSDFMNIGPVDFDAFNATLMRGEVCPHPRLEKVPVTLPIPFNTTSTVFDKKIEVPEPEL